MVDLITNYAVLAVPFSLLIIGVLVAEFVPRILKK